MATVGTAGGHQLLLGIADDLQPHGHNCSVFSLHVSDTTTSTARQPLYPAPYCIPGDGQDIFGVGPDPYKCKKSLQFFLSKLYNCALKTLIQAATQTLRECLK